MLLPAFLVSGVIFGRRVCSRDVVRATVVGCRDTGHDTTDHPGAFADDSLPVAGAGSPARYKQPDPGESAKVRTCLDNVDSGESSFSVIVRSTVLGKRE